ncbi:DUF2306 domain-containing protein [Luteimonas gilva]|uniref:DUF2306 domain-containing protein n=2 Tax=Luteimonas gilva TaxID=2572684 RepID=A0A4U5JZB3_9GAMM|nr:DUF2306 domain-containing protein [Luteimonas gilva]
MTLPAWHAAVRWTGASLAAIAWASGALFALYILAFYGGALLDGATGQGNASEQAPRIWDPATLRASIGIGMHLLAGTVLLLLGPIQLIAPLRARWPKLHRWSGRIYASAAILAGAGGLVFIVAKGTIGGTAMDIAFAIYGLALILAAGNAVRHARARRFDAHRAWAIRLFALVIGSWLYRIEYTAWRVFAGGLGHTATFDGPFDTAMLYFFFVPNLLLAEAFLRARKSGAGWAQATAVLAMAGTAVALAVLTYLLTLRAWGPPIAARLFGA